MSAAWPSRARQFRQFGRHMPRVVHEDFAADVQQPRLAPARHGRLLHHLHRERARPAARHAGAIHPGNLLAPLRRRASRSTPTMPCLPTGMRTAFSTSSACTRWKRPEIDPRVRTGRSSADARQRDADRRPAALRPPAAGAASWQPAGSCQPAAAGLGGGCDGGFLRPSISPHLPAVRARSWFPAPASTARRSRCRRRVRPSAPGCGRSCRARC